MKRAIVVIIACFITGLGFGQMSFENKLKSGFNPIINFENNIGFQKNPKLDFINYYKSCLTDDQPEKQQYSYEHYEKLYYKSKSNRNMGILMAVFGTGLMTVSYLTLNNSSNGNTTAEKSASIIGIAGGALVDVGVFLWIYNGIKASNNRKAMERTAKQ